MAKICPKCGNELADSANFCGNCGSKFEEIVQETERKIVSRKRKWNKRLIIIVAVLIVAALRIISGAISNTAGNIEISAEEVKERFCNNIGISYNSDEWKQKGEAREGLITEMYISEPFYIGVVFDKDNNACSIGVSYDLLYATLERSEVRFSLECAAVSAMTGCSMDEADTIVRNANISDKEIFMIDDNFGIMAGYEDSIGSEGATYFQVIKKM